MTRTQKVKALTEQLEKLSGKKIVLQEGIMEEYKSSQAQYEAASNINDLVENFTNTLDRLSKKEMIQQYNVTMEELEVLQRAGYIFKDIYEFCYNRTLKIANKLKAGKVK